MLVWFVPALIAVALILPYAITLWLNARMLRRLERVCRETGVRMKRLYRALIFVRNRSDRYDLLLESETTVYAVKLWSAYHTGNTLVITKEGAVFEQKRELLPMDLLRENVGKRAKGIKRSVPRTKLLLGKNEKRSVTKILLQYPAYREVLAVTEQGLVRLNSGSALYDKLLYSPSALESLLRQRGQEKSQ